MPKVIYRYVLCIPKAQGNLTTVSSGHQLRIFVLSHNMIFYAVYRLQYLLRRPQENIKYHCLMRVKLYSILRNEHTVCTQINSYEDRIYVAKFVHCLNSYRMIKFTIIIYFYSWSIFPIAYEK